ncbi:sulfite exporter TauE/SafE family protein [Bacillus sp. Marseille-P3661]|uniref:sulfite exporter TauE/SafE family protein n=1 Tax=Bacillus sp. Marseille-P3661 TaxID=1936234 RepID=UPI000C832DB1|nr:sulfite exporter TauE/SafE family protein [Bacillus sp. Marseille-P3661]
MEWIILVFVGFCSGMIGSLVGLGGGVILIPFLLFLGAYTTLVTPISPQVLVGISLIVMIFTGLSSTLAYVKHKRVDYKSGLIFFIGSGPGAILGSFLNKYLTEDIFSVFFGVFVIVLSFVLMFRNRVKPLLISKDVKFTREYKETDGTTVIYGFKPWIAICLTFVVGFLSGFIGIGGGSLMVPAMILLFGFPISVAVATSMFMVFLSAIVGSSTHLFLGNVDWVYALALIPGAWFGGKTGVFINSKLKSDTVVLLLRWILVIIGLQLIYQGIQ